MTGQVVNLRQARKTKTRAEKRAAGDANAARHGETKAARTKRDTEATREAARLDAHEVDR